MLRFNRGQVHPIGLDVGHDSIKMLQLEQTGGHLSVLAAARASIPGEAKADPQRWQSSVVGLIQKMLRRYPFRGRSVVTALPREMVHIRTIRVPVGSAEEIREAVSREATAIFAFAPGQAQIAQLLAGEVREGPRSWQEVVVIASRNADITSYLKMLSRARVRVQSLDVEPCAVYRTVDRFLDANADRDKVRVLVDVGGTGSQVVIGRGSEINFIRPIDIGGRHIHEGISRKLGISKEEAQGLRRRLSESRVADETEGKRDRVRQAAADASRGVVESLVREISLSLRYYAVTFPGHGPTQLQLIGGEAFDTQLQAELHTAVSVPIVLGNSLSLIDASWMNETDQCDAQPAWSLAFGLALKTVCGTLQANRFEPVGISGASATRGETFAHVPAVPSSESAVAVASKPLASREATGGASQTAPVRDRTATLMSSIDGDPSAGAFYKTEPVAFEPLTEAARRIEEVGRTSLTMASSEVPGA